MHQTTFGVTHKVEIFNQDNISRFLKEQKIKFEQCLDKNNCIYPNKKILNSASINYLNIHEDSSVRLPDFQLKYILRKEFDECEKTYPFLGQVFLNLFFEKKVLDSKRIKLINKSNYLEFVNTLEEKNAANVLRWIFENSSTERAIDVSDAYVDSIHLTKENDIFFKIEYDTDFLGDRKDLEMKNYRFIIIDGYIESVSEIHHMLHFAASSKEPYVLFCFGMSEEVKNVIIQNNSKQITQVFPVVMQVSEDSANILNDIALLHNSDIITSLKGQTISQAMRSELSIGKGIVFNRQGFKVQALCTKKDITSHIKFLENRIKNSPADANTELIKNRIKILRNKVLNIHLPESLKNDVSFNIDLDYGLRMINYNQVGYYEVILGDRKIMIPKFIYEHALKKVNITKEMLYNVEKILIIQE